MSPAVSLDYINRGFLRGVGLQVSKFISLPTNPGMQRNVIILTQ